MSIDNKIVMVVRQVKVKVFYGKQMFSKIVRCLNLKKRPECSFVLEITQIGTYYLR